MSDTKDNTTVKQVDVDLADILGTGVDGIMLPGEEDPEKKPSVLSPINTDTSFLDKPPVDAGGTDDPPADPPPADPPVDPPVDGDPPPADPPPAEIDPLAQKLDTDPPEDDPDKKKGGRPTIAVGALKSLFEKKILQDFDDDKKLEDYTQADVEELIQVNIAEQRKAFEAELPQQFFGQMPSEMQQAWQYISNGGQDLKGLFQAMSSSQEIREVDIKNEAGQTYAVRAYLQATNYGTPEEIEDDVHSIADRGDLEKKATQFKPKLDKMSEDMVNHKLATQAAETQARQKQSQAYMDNVHSILEKGELNGIKLDNKTQNMLYAGLVQPNYPSAVNGKQTNQLGHLLEKYQWVEPRHDLVAEALWLLADPDGYRDEIRKQGGEAQVQETVRKLKSEQQAGKNGTAVEEDNEPGQRKRQNGVPRQKKNFFGR